MRECCVDFGQGERRGSRRIRARRLERRVADTHLALTDEARKKRDGNLDLVRQRCAKTCSDRIALRNAAARFGGTCRSSDEFGENRGE